MQIKEICSPFAMQNIDKIWKEIKEKYPDNYDDSDDDDDDFLQVSVTDIETISGLFKSGENIGCNRKRKTGKRN